MDQIYTDKLMEFTSGLGFSEVTAQKFMELGEIVEIKRKDFLVRQGEICRYIATVLEGEFRFIHEKNDGKEPMVIAFKTNGFVTEYHSFLRQIPAKYSIIAQTDTVVCRVTHQQVMDFYEYNIEGQRFGRQIAGELFFLRDELLFSFRCDSSEVRYLKLLKVLKDLNLELNLKDMASLIGVTPETVSRIRKKLMGK